MADYVGLFPTESNGRLPVGGSPHEAGVWTCGPCPVPSYPQDSSVSLPSWQTAFGLCLQNPTTDYPWAVTPTQQSLEHAHHVLFLLSPRFPTFAAASSKSLSVSRSLTDLSEVGNSEIQW